MVTAVLPGVDERGGTDLPSTLGSEGEDVGSPSSSREDDALELLLLPPDASVPPAVVAAAAAVGVGGGVGAGGRPDLTRR